MTKKQAQHCENTSFNILKFNDDLMVNFHNLNPKSFTLLTKKSHC